MWKKPVPPKCADCGKANPHAVRKPGDIEDLDPRHTRRGVFDWLCGSCELLRANPTLDRGVLMPRERRPLKVQRERLLDVLAP